MARQVMYTIAQQLLLTLTCCFAVATHLHAVTLMHACMPTCIPIYFPSFPSFLPSLTLPFPYLTLPYLTYLPTTLPLPLHVTFTLHYIPYLPCLHPSYLPTYIDTYIRT